MAFLKGLDAEDMEVRVLSLEETLAYSETLKEWERSLQKTLQTDLRVDARALAVYI